MHTVDRALWWRVWPGTHQSRRHTVEKGASTRSRQGRQRADSPSRGPFLFSLGDPTRSAHPFQRILCRPLCWAAPQAPNAEENRTNQKNKKGAFQWPALLSLEKKIKRVWRVNTHDRAVAPKDNRRSLRANTIGRTMSAPDRGNLFFFLSFRWVCTALCSAALHSPMFLFFLPPIWCGLSSLGEDKRGAAAVWGFVASVIVVVVVVVMR